MRILLAAAFGLVMMRGSTGTQDKPGEKSILLSCDFELENWWQAWGSKGVPRNCTLIEGKEAHGGKGKSLKVVIPGGNCLGTSFGYAFRERIGREPEEMYFRYYVKFDPDWKNAVDGGKMPGFACVSKGVGSGGERVNGKDGWSARGHFSAAGPGATNIGYYCYHADMVGDYGNIWKFNTPLKNGRWYCVEEYCKMNTPGTGGGRGKNDGILRGWIDGHVAFEKTDVRFRDIDALKIEQVWVNIYHGGRTPPPSDIHLYFDDLVISTKYIGPKKAGAEPSK